MCIRSEDSNIYVVGVDIQNKQIEIAKRNNDETWNNKRKCGKQDPNSNQSFTQCGRIKM